MRLLDVLRRPRREDRPPPLYRYPRTRWAPRPDEIEEYGYIRMACPWCGRETWATAHSEPIGLAKRYGPCGATSGDSTCFNCGRGIFFWGMPWVYHAEFDDDGSSVTYYSWDDKASDRRGERTGVQASSRPEGTPLRTWVRTDPDAPTLYAKVREAPAHPCSLGRHQRAWYSSGWSDVPGALVLWRCGRCHIDLGWGRYDDGPGAPYLPAPSEAEQDEWRRIGRAMQEEEERAAAARNTEDIEGECNARWATNRCARAAGHAGDHGIEIAPGLILAPWPNEAKAR